MHVAESPNHAFPTDAARDERLLIHIRSLIQVDEWKSDGATEKQQGSQDKQGHHAGNPPTRPRGIVFHPCPKRHFIAQTKLKKLPFASASIGSRCFSPSKRRGCR